jgi:cytochrome o ubiquinol oxidase operon protein cyoD
MELTRTYILRIVGFILSLIITLIAFSIFYSPYYFGLSTSGASLTVFILALIQAAVQFFFFLQIAEKGSHWNTTFFIATLLTLFIVIFFSIWIMDHLNYNMIPQKVTPTLYESLSEGQG